MSEYIGDAPLTLEQRKDKFLEELTALSLKYEIEIGGCGCCGSPWVSGFEPDGKYFEHLQLSEETGKYEHNL